ncbi:MAG TPA: DUF1501 domain-containing protein [Gemmataceae bacterium]|nr:DUF1501 domain-containing protein [Gemmataceae bacterium]
MLNFQSETPVRFCDGMSRRDFLRVGSLSAGSVGLSLADLQAAQNGGAADGVNCILLFLVGGPSQLDTWDPKPAAASTIRSPFRPIATKVPGLTLCETFPLMAQMADRFAVVRSVHHIEAPIHETGQQLMQTGRLCRDGLEYPHYGAVLSHLRGQRGALPPFALLPGPMGNTGVSVGHGQGAGFLGIRHEPFALRRDPVTGVCDLDHIDLPPGLDPARMHNRHDLISAIDDAQRAFDQAGGPGHACLQQLFAGRVRRAYDLAAEPSDLREGYGSNTFGQSCLLARRLVEHGVRLVTVNMFDTVFDNVSWDCHADGGSLSTTLDDYQATVCPMFDRAYTALLRDLDERGLLTNTLVVAVGEFGRTPQRNPRGGRDHWPGVWSILFAGAGVRGGQTIGSSDKIGAEPSDRPVSPAEVAATVYQALGVDIATQLPGPHGRRLSLVDAVPIRELF